MEDKIDNYLLSGFRKLLIIAQSWFVKKTPSPSGVSPENSTSWKIKNMKHIMIIQK